MRTCSNKELIRSYSFYVIHETAKEYSHHQLICNRDSYRQSSFQPQYHICSLLNWDHKNETMKFVGSFLFNSISNTLLLL